MQTIDGRGSVLELRTARGAELNFELDLDPESVGTDFAGYSVRMVVNGLYVPTLAVLSDKVIIVTLGHLYTLLLPPAARYRLSLVQPNGSPWPLTYGALYTDDWGV